MILPNYLRVVFCLIAASITAQSVFAASSDPILPDLKLTPGVFYPKLSTAKICKTKWGLDKRHVTENMKQQAFKEYGIDPARHHDFEIDHLVSRELGGAEGKIFTVRYEAVNAMLLNEFLKEHKKVTQLEAAATEEQKEIKFLTAALEKQASRFRR